MVSHDGRDLLLNGHQSEEVGGFSCQIRLWLHLANVVHEESVALWVSHNVVWRGSMVWTS
jgi:hypothetical protein